MYEVKDGGSEGFYLANKDGEILRLNNGAYALFSTFDEANDAKITINGTGICDFWKVRYCESSYLYYLKKQDVYRDSEGKQATWYFAAEAQEKADELNGDF